MTAALTCDGPGRRDCACPRSRHEHGTQLAYVRDGCRGDACRAANTARERVRTRAKLYGRYDGLVDADPARAHIRLLSEHGVGLKQITRLSGVSGGVLTKLLYGHPLPDGTRRPPSRRCTPRVRDRILAVPADAHAAGARVDGTGTRRRLQSLIACGWSQQKLAHRLGMATSNFGKTIRADQVLVATRDAVTVLYDQLWDQPPPTATHRDKIAYSRSIRFAAEHAYPPPLAWDEESIDDPAARPMIDPEPDGEQEVDEIAVELLAAGTLRAAHAAGMPERVEAVRRLAATGHSDKDIGRRIGMTRDGAKKLRERNGIPSGEPCSRPGAAA